MYTLFTSRPEPQYPVTMSPAFEMIRRNFQKEINKIVDYYNNRVFAVQGNHLLVRLLMLSPVSPDATIDQFMATVYARAPYIAKHFRFTSEIEYGIFHDGPFYGPGNRELIFYNEDYFDPYEATANWKTQKPIKVLDHQISDLGLLLPNGKTNSTGMGFCAVSINLPLLICQYRAFLMDQDARRKSSDGVSMLLGTNHFVNMYVLPSMLESHVDVALMNRMSNLFYGNEMSKPVRKYVFHVIDQADKVDKVLLEVIRRLSDKRANYAAYLENIPSVYHKSMLESLKMPDLSRTKQVFWGLIVSRLAVMNFLLQLGGENGVASNGTFVNELKKICKYLTHESMLQALLPPSQYLDVSEFIDSVLKA